MMNTELLIEEQIENIQYAFRLQQKQAKLTKLESYTERIDKLKKLEKWIKENREKIKEAIFKDFSKPPEEVDLTEIFAVLSDINYNIKHLKKWMKPQKVHTPLTLLGTSSYIQFESKGVCLIIAPWNYPFQLVVSPLISAIAAGNTAILKPSEMTPNTSKLIVDMCSDIFEPSEVVAFEGAIEVSKTLLELPFDHIFFTGSPAVGKIVMAAAAKNLTSVTLELGGKSPTIIDETANLEDAAEKIVYGKFVNNGQTCIAPDYLLVHQNVEFALIDEMRKVISKMFDHDGKGIDNSPNYARIVNEKHYFRLVELIDSAAFNGAEIAIGGKYKLDERFISPTIIRKISKDSLLLDEEIFGPILPIVTYTDAQECVDFINDRPKPLAQYIFSKSSENQQFILKNTSAGGVCINDCLIHFMNHELPFGGVNNSGIGKSHGLFGFKEFSNEKGILKQRIGRTAVKPLYPPYSATSRKVIDFLMKYF
jgi:aldehyde dehydrogenase (NAD+)